MLLLSQRSWRTYCCCFLRCFLLRQHVQCGTAVTACCLEAWGTDVSRGANPDRQRWQGPAGFGGSRMTCGACARLNNGCRTYVSICARIQHFGSLQSQPVAVGGRHLLLVGWLGVGGWLVGLAWPGQVGGLTACLVFCGASSQTIQHDHKEISLS